MRNSFLQRHSIHKLTVLDAEFMTFKSEHELHLEALRTERFFLRQFQWTGISSETELIPEIISEHDKFGVPRHRLHGDMICEGNNRMYIIDLGRTLAIGDVDTVKIAHTLRDFEKKFEPIMSVGPRASTSEIQKLELAIQVPVDSTENVRHETYAGSDKKIIDTQKLQPISVTSGIEEYRIVIDENVTPNRGHGISWDIKSRLT